MNIYNKKIILITALLSSFHCAARAMDWRRMTYVRDMSNRHSNIYLLSGADNSQFLIKQRMACGVHAVFMTVVETFGAYVAQTVGIPGNRVSLVAAREQCPFAELTKYPATLHTFMPGAEVKTVKRFADVSFNLRCTRKNGKGVCGLTHQHVKNMALHPDLPKIMAVDTFIGNKRHGANLLYDERADRFYAIDFGATLRSSFGKASVKQLSGILANADSFNGAEIEALFSYYKTLKRLLKMHSLQSLMRKLQELTEQAELSPSTPFCKDATKSYKKYIRERKKCLRENYYGVQEMVAIFEKFFRNADD